LPTSTPSGLTGGAGRRGNAPATTRASSGQRCGWSVTKTESPLAFEKVWREWIRAAEQGTDYAFTIRCKDGCRFIGLAGLHDASGARPELGIWVSESEHGHGYGFEAVQAVARWWSTKGSPAAFHYPVAEVNQSSRRIAERLGGTVVAFEVTPKYNSVIYQIPPVVPDPSAQQTGRDAG
jgi:RimJ/RimL family protein N-acetyltransferase